MSENIMSHSSHFEKTFMIWISRLFCLPEYFLYIKFCIVPKSSIFRFEMTTKLLMKFLYVETECVFNHLDHKIRPHFEYILASCNSVMIRNRRQGRTRNYCRWNYEMCFFEFYRKIVNLYINSFSFIFPFFVDRVSQWRLKLFQNVIFFKN